MQTFLATLALMAVLMLAMGVGVIVTGRRLRGSCGGVGGPACECDPAERATCRRTKAQARP
jgi:hypothetical protein